MKTWCKATGVVLIGMIISIMPVFGLETFIEGDPILTQEIDDVVGSEIQESDDPIRDGTYIVAQETEGIYNEEELSDTETSWEKTLNYIKGFLNYALGIIGLVALAYLIYHGFLTLTAGDNEERLNKGREGIKYGAMAIIGIGVAWFVVSLLFWLVYTLTDLG